MKLTRTFSVTGFLWLGFLPVCSCARLGSAQTEKLTFNNDVAPIIFKRCSSCHRPGQVAPFSLLNYGDVSKRAALIGKAVEDHAMPPWKPEPGYGDFVGGRRLPDDEIRTIKRWIEQGLVEGDARDLPPAPQFSNAWFLGAPDLVVRLPEPFTVSAGNDVYRCFVLPLGLSEDRYVSAYEFRPGNRRVVHHAIIVEDTYGAAQRVLGDSASGYSCFGGFGFPVPGYLGFWTPGAVPRPWPEGIGKELRKGSGLVVQVHFHPASEAATVQFEIGLYFSKRRPERIPFDIPVGTMDLDIPPGVKNYPVKSYTYIAEDVDAIGIIPHAHFLGKEVKARATLPDGQVVPLIWIRHWDFNWQEQYRYVSPVRLPKGTRIDVQWTYDNSSDNPRNPNHPPKRVTWGEGTTDEMSELHIEVVPAGPARPVVGGSIEPKQ
jgi:hypothetical protein